jgi:Ca2+-binding RTX toxin-like protein
LALLVGAVPATAGSAVAAAPPGPRESCVVGDTPGARYDTLIAILIGSTSPDDGLTLGSDWFQCPGVSLLPYLEQDNLVVFVGLSADEMWSRFETGGQSLTMMAREQGIDRDALLEHVRGAYTAAADAALADGFINDTQRQRVLDAVLPNYGWLIDWRHGDPLGVAAGDVNLDTVADVVVSCAPGGGAGEQIDNVVRLILGLTVDGFSGSDLLTVDGCEALAVIAATDFTPPFPSLLSSDDSFAAYQDGQSLLDLFQQGQGADFLDGLYRDLRSLVTQRVGESLDRLSVEDQARVAQEAFLIIVSTLKHHAGDALPGGLVGARFADEESAARAAAPTCHGVPSTIVIRTAGLTTNGTNGDDVIFGTSGDDDIAGDGGDDLICGEGGDDYLHGNQGHDEIYGGYGEDEIYGELCCIGAVVGQDDVLHGGPGDDDLYGQIGDDVLYGDGGNDLLDGSDGADDLYGGDGNDTLDGGTGRDTCTGGSGNNTFSQC